MSKRTLKTVREVSELTGVSVRTLQYYDKIGLLRPAEHTEAGYRLYDGPALERLRQILFFRELEFPLREIGRILDSPDFDRARALEQQITLLTLKKEHIERLIAHAKETYPPAAVCMTKGEEDMDFSAFDKSKIEEYAAEARAAWSGTEAYGEYEERAKGRSDADAAGLAEGMAGLFREFGAIKDGDPASPEARALVEKLRDYITANFYTCTDAILAGLGEMYTADARFAANIDSAGGEGTAEFAGKAIKEYCAGPQS